MMFILPCSVHITADSRWEAEIYIYHIISRWETANARPWHDIWKIEAKLLGAIYYFAAGIEGTVERHKLHSCFFLSFCGPLPSWFRLKKPSGGSFSDCEAPYYLYHKHFIHIIHRWSHVFITHTTHTHTQISSVLALQQYYQYGVRYFSSCFSHSSLPYETPKNQIRPLM